MRGWKGVYKSRAEFSQAVKHHSQASVMKHFCKNSQWPTAIFTKSCVIENQLGSKYASEKT